MKPQDTEMKYIVIDSNELFLRIAEAVFQAKRPEGMPIELALGEIKEHCGQNMYNSLGRVTEVVGEYIVEVMNEAVPGSASIKIVSPSEKELKQ
jgi:hypothetical protein